MPPPIDITRFEHLKTAGDLPSPKGVALAIIRLTRKDDLSLAELARVIKTDPAFVGRLIKAANSAAMGARRPVASVQEALMVLGLPAVRNMALGFSLLSNYRNGGCANFDYERYWSGALLMALAAQAIGQRVHCAAADEMFCLGLLSRVGELALATLHPKQYSDVLAEAAAPGGDLVACEQRAFAMHHRELTAVMLADWGLPKLFYEPAAHFEMPDDAPFAEDSRAIQIVAALSLADAIRAICLAAPDARPALTDDMYQRGQSLSLDPDGLNALSDQVVEEWGEWGRLLRVATQPVPPLASVAAAGTPVVVGALRADPRDGVAAEEAPVIARPKGASSMRVLVVDDNAEVRTSLRGLLERAGHLVFESDNGRHGMELALEVQPQMMLVDAHMPEMSGLDLTRALRQTRIGRTIYILLLTSLEDEERLIEAFENGVDDFVTKPIRPRVLAARLRAGHRVIRLQQEVEHEREEIRRFAAELAVTNRRLHEVALTDQLTGFPNRRYAIERIAQEWAGATRSRRPLSCMVIDIDEFKQINDTYGHDAGDMVLRQASVALKHGLRSQDVVARTGGDEFLVLCPDTDLSAALRCAERLRQAVHAAKVVAGNVKLRVSISVGVAQRDRSMGDADAMIKRADQGAYVAKAQGRNRVASVQLSAVDSSGAVSQKTQILPMSGSQVALQPTAKVKDRSTEHR
ncbi:MAG: diguanylate cyclase [Rhodocyclaceae bacterium]|nr:diguanylate cyclase [Rhodocyclaceae bacterium]